MVIVIIIHKNPRRTEAMAMLEFNAASSTNATAIT